MTTPLSPANSGADHSDTPTEVFAANPPAGDATVTEANPTAPNAAAASPAQETDTTPSFFSPNQAVPAGEATTSVPRLRPRFGTIFWGILLLAFATYMVVFTLLPVPPDPTLWLLGGVIAVGLGLVVAGIAAAARRAD
ncbi:MULTISPECIES: hypothetical protein [unclassified Cryobacterium]|uniref:hypothetical protein n=1 Tax=unclassified Cryobacterium TaxID=2649013 RepID=UPI000CE471EB|nr:MULTISPECIES: hypothetical protein [unclassified Cryobacterium]